MSILSDKVSVLAVVVENAFSYLFCLAVRFVTK